MTVMINYSPFCKKQTDYIRRCFNSWLNCAEGGKRAGKNIIDLIAWATALENHPDKLHLAAGVSVASAKLNIIDSNGFGLKYLFAGMCREGSYQNRDALYIQTKTGEKIILISGGGDNGSEKFIKGNSYGTAYITEVNECAPTFVKEVFDRTLSSSKRQIFFDLNPKAPNHWFYTDVLDLHQENAYKYPNYGFNYEHFTIFDNLSFDDDKIRATIRTYAKNSIWYIRDILGKRTNAEGVIYDMFGLQNQYEDGDGPNYNLYYRRYYSIDYGTTNPFSCHEYIEQNGRIFVENEYYYDSKKHNRQKDDGEYSEDILKFISNKRYSNIIIDPSAASFKVALRKRVLRTRETDELINANHEVINGIRLVASLLKAIHPASGKPYLMVNKTRCPNLLNEFASYIWDEKASERGMEAPVKQMDHGMDELRYFCKTIVKYIPGVK
jgi:PBSX family phage terminase large subunit